MRTQLSPRLPLTLPLTLSLPLPYPVTLPLISLSSLIFLFIVPFNGSITASQVIQDVDENNEGDCLANKTFDIVLLIDGSKSVHFAIKLSRTFNISKNDNHLTVIQYAEEARIEAENEQIESLLPRMVFLGGPTNTARALSFVSSSVLPQTRSDATKVLIVMTDGQSQDDVAPAAQELRDKHVIVYAIGVTNLVNLHELHLISSSDERTFTVESFSELDFVLLDSLLGDMCRSLLIPPSPEIICEDDHIGVHVQTANPFEGWVFVEGHFHDTECRKGPADFADSRNITFRVPFSDCGVRRYRTLDPSGFFVEATVVFMFHMMFMMKTDQRIKIQCFYMESDKAASIPMSVSMLSTVFRDAAYEMPRCSYSLRKGAPDGPPVQHASIGEHIFHRWECEDSHDTFGMLVHSCVVDDGKGHLVQSLDEKGQVASNVAIIGFSCGIDKIILRTPEYSSSLRVATQSYWVFKFADKPVLFFQCQITLCVKYGDGCSGVTPPVCPNSLAGRRKRSPSLSMDVLSPPLHVLTFPIPPPKCPSLFLPSLVTPLIIIPCLLICLYLYRLF